MVLFDISSAAENMNAWKQELYEKAQIGIPHSDRECNDLIILGFMMAQFIADFKWQVSQSQEKEAKVLAHFHEWMSGVSLIMLRLWKAGMNYLGLHFVLNFFITRSKSPIVAKSWFFLGLRMDI